MNHMHMDVVLYKTGNAVGHWVVLINSELNLELLFKGLYIQLYIFIFTAFSIEIENHDYSA